MPNATALLPVLASTDLDVFDADQRHRIPAAAGLAAITPALDPAPVRPRKPARIEEAPLDRGVPMVWREFDHEIRMAYDPAQISPEEARAGLAIWFNYVEVTPAPVIPADILAANLANASLVKACRRAELPPLTPGAIRVLIEIAKMKAGQDANCVAFLDHLAGLIWQAGDATAVLAQVAELIGTARTTEAAR